MALDAFYKLKERKQKNLMTSIANCLKTHAYDDLLVSDIANEADISRGSFYNYFVDKNDAVFTMVTRMLAYQVSVFKEIVLKNEGDIFKSTLELFDQVCDRLKGTVKDAVIHNMRIYINMITKIISSEKYSNDVEELVKWSCTNTIIGKENIVDESGMANTLELLFSTAVHEIARYFVASENRKKYVSFPKKLEIIRTGIYAMKNQV